jgi:hypothetical protein
MHVLSFPTIADMQSSGAFSFGQLAQVAGYYDPGDGGGGTFFFDTAPSASTGDHGLVFPSSSGDGGWRRIVQGHLDVRWFGAKGEWDPENGLAIYDPDPAKRPFDDWDAFKAAIAAFGTLGSKLTANMKVASTNTKGGTLVANGYFYLSKTLHIERSIILQGTANNSLSLAHLGDAPVWRPGTVLAFPTPETGIRIHSEKDSPDGGSGAKSVIRDLMLCCVKPGDWTPDKEPLYRDATPPKENVYRRGQLPHGHGIHMSAAASIENVNIEHFTGNGINIVATGKAVETAGNANGFQIRNCEISYSAGHGVYVYGNDVQGGLVQRTTAIVNLGWGFFDESAAGSTYISCLGEYNRGHYNETNSNRDYKTAGATDDVTTEHEESANASCFVGCYTEGPNKGNEVAEPSMVLGGLLAQEDANIAETTAFLLSGGLKSGVAYRSPFAHENHKGPRNIRVELGGTDKRMAALVFQTLEQKLLPLDYGELVFDASTQWWMFANITQPYLGLPTHMLKLRKLAPLLPNGVFYGPYNDLTLHASATDMPAEGEWKEGDIVWNKNPSHRLKRCIGWICTKGSTAGAKAEFRSFGEISP